MPFDVPGMTSAIVAINAAPPQTEQEVADAWAAALRTFFTPLGLPALIPGTLVLAEAACSAAMAPLIAPIPGVGASSLAAGWAAFVLAFVAGGAPPQIVVPPPAPFVPPALPPINDPNIPAAAIAAATATWALTGTVTIPPAGPVPWA